MAKVGVQGSTRKTHTAVACPVIIDTWSSPVTAPAKIYLNERNQGLAVLSHQQLGWGFYGKGSLTVPEPTGEVAPEVHI